MSLLLPLLLKCGGPIKRPPATLHTVPASHMSKCWITLILLCAAMHARGAAGLSRAVTISSELVLALSLNPEVNEVVLTGNIELTDDSFLGHPSPVFLSANITITGQQSSQSLWPRLDLAYLKDKARHGAHGGRCHASAGTSSETATVGPPRTWRSPLTGLPILHS